MRRSEAVFRLSNFLKYIKRFFTKPYGVFYSDLSPFRKAWLALWERPKGNYKEALEMNKEVLKKMRDAENAD